MTKSVLDVREFNNAREAVVALGLLLDCVSGCEIVYVVPGGRPGTASLIEETLTDGSIAYEIAMMLPEAA